MQINNKDLKDWTIDDIMTLIGDEQWRESSTIDYKREFRARDEGFKKDVCAFANAQGGYLFMGIDEDDGLATAIVGIEDVGLDDYNLSISNALSSSVEPSRPAYESHLIPIEEGKCILIIHVFEGYDKPYRVRNEGRFWLRGNAGNEQMSYMVIEEMFLRTNGQKDKLQQIIDGRLSFLKMRNNPAYLQYLDHPFLTFHFLPLSSVSGHEKRYPVGELLDSSDGLFSFTGLTAGQQFKTEASKINMDGLIRYQTWENDGSGDLAHIQLFWNGTVEMATNGMFHTGPNTRTMPYFQADLMIELIPALLSAAVSYFALIGMNEPFFAVLSIENAGNYVAFIDLGQSANLDRDQLRTYAVRIDEKSEPALQSAVDTLLDEFGYLIGLSSFHDRRSKQ